MKFKNLSVKRNAKKIYLHGNAGSRCEAASILSYELKDVRNTHKKKLALALIWYHITHLSV